MRALEDMYHGWVNGVQLSFLISSLNRNDWLYFSEPRRALKYDILLNTSSDKVIFYEPGGGSLDYSTALPPNLTLEEAQAWAIAVWRMG